MAEFTSSAGSNPLSTKLSYVLGTSFTDYGLRQALESLDNQFPENTQTSRRHLRDEFEWRSIESARELLDNYAQVVAVVTTYKSFLT